MEQSTLMASLQATLGGSLPGILAAMAVLALGWFAAVLLRAGSRRFLRVAGVNHRLQSGTGQVVDLESMLSLGVFGLVLLITVVAVLNILDLESLSTPFAGLLAQITNYLPHLLAGGILTVVAWVLATVLRMLTSKVLASTTLDERLAAEAGMEPMSANLGNVAFWLVVLLFLPAILGAFQLQGLLEPVQGMVDRALQMLPDIFAALVIGFVGWLVANVLRGLVGNLLAAAGADKLGTCIGMDASVKLSRLAGTLVFILVFVPSLIAALDALRIEAVSGPAISMLDQFFGAVPNILAAAVILVVTWFVARFAAGLVSRLLAGIGFDLLPGKLGLAHALGEGLSASALAGRLVLFFAMLFAVVEAANRLGFGQVSGLVTMFVQFGGDILLGGVILIAGFWLANVAAEAIDRASGEHSRGLSRIARVAILGLVIAMGLRAMGIADDIVNLAFGLGFGAVAVAVALSFGLGGREAAGRQMEYWLARMRKDDSGKD
ncbi:mechanosensitive ion channel [Azoarcus sp. L1K30]|uniref:mechanosensitive ion channel n=1 Tax=Azoarcus sp. L1K30 TaxID=2820277 RepID=UPI001B82DB27|nr:mechanosensitive ion channel [Azoarcus sp. L1K30]MBR0566420.1 mechanosensitive ion channel [Azoarcus sp. L1K30]